jgi:serine/threonine protein kinase
MEQMNEELYDAVLTIPVQTNAVHMAPVARRMLQIFHRVHELGCVLTDVKPENFMLVAKEGPVEDRLRLLDLGLLLQYRMGGHLPNEGLATLRGTPTYASLPVHALNTPSRRDDIAAFLFLLCDLVICVSAHHTNQTPTYFKKGSYLPWSDGTSDEDIGQQKKAQVSDPKSELYARMPPAAAAVLFQCLQEVGTYKYKQEPNYAFFETAFGELVVPLPVGTKKRVAAKATARRTPRRKTAPAAAAVEEEVYDSDRDEDHREEAVPMEIEDWGHEENLKPAANKPAVPKRSTTKKAPARDTSPKKNRVYHAAVLEATSGPHKGEKWVVQEGSEKFCIGSNPTKSNHEYIVLSKDSAVAANHSRITLYLNKRMLRINVWDLKSGSGTLVGATRLVSTADTAAYNGCVIQVGDTELRVSGYSPS